LSKTQAEVKQRKAKFKQDIRKKQRLKQQGNLLTKNFGCKE